MENYQRRLVQKKGTWELYTAVDFFALPPCRKLTLEERYRTIVTHARVWFPTHSRKTCITIGEINTFSAR